MFPPKPKRPPMPRKPAMPPKSGFAPPSPPMPGPMTPPTDTGQGGPGISGLLPRPRPRAPQGRVPGGIPGLNQMRADLASPRKATTPKKAR